MIRLIAKLFVFALALTSFLHVAPLSAAGLTGLLPVAYISSTGSDSNPCTAALPCATLDGVISALGTPSVQVNCLNSPAPNGSSLIFGGTTVMTIDCAGAFYVTSSVAAFALAADMTVKIRNLTISGIAGGFPAIKVTGSGTLILENCVFENFNASGAGPPLDIEPSGAFNLVMTNSRISNNAAGVLIKPAVGGSVTATFNGVTIADNMGGGLKTDTTNGLVSVDISNSTISNNVGNGMNAVSGAGGTNMLNIRNSVIARNGSAGVQANGANAAALVNNTLLDSNAAGATAAINGGRVLTYGNNSVVGIPGSGFTGPAALQ